MSKMTLVGWGAGLIVLATLTPSTVAGRQDASLRAAHDDFVRLWMAGDVTAIDPRLQPQAVGFWADSSAPTDFQNVSPAKRQDALRRMLAVTGHLRVAEINMKYRTFNDTGIVWGFYKVEYTDQKRSRRTAEWRTTEVYTKAAGQWLLAAWHLSDIPARSGD